MSRRNDYTSIITEKKWWAYRRVWAKLLTYRSEDTKSNHIKSYHSGFSGFIKYRIVTWCLLYLKRISVKMGTMFIWYYSAPAAHSGIAPHRHVALISENVHKRRSKRLQDTCGIHVAYASTLQWHGQKGALQISCHCCSKWWQKFNIMINCITILSRYLWVSRGSVSHFITNNITKLIGYSHITYSISSLFSVLIYFWRTLGPRQIIGIPKILNNLK